MGFGKFVKKAFAKQAKYDPVFRTDAKIIETTSKPLVRLSGGKDPVAGYAYKQNEGGGYGEDQQGHKIAAAAVVGTYFGASALMGAAGTGGATAAGTSAAVGVEGAAATGGGAWWSGLAAGAGKFASGTAQSAGQSLLMGALAPKGAADAAGPVAELPPVDLRPAVKAEAGQVQKGGEQAALLAAGALLLFSFV